MVELTPREVRIDAIDVTEAGRDFFTLDVCCGKGTYIRSLARDLAEALGTVGYVTMLRRTAASGFDVKDAAPMAALTDSDWTLAAHLRPMADALPAMPYVVLTADLVKDVNNGRIIPTPLESTPLPRDAHVALLDENRRLVAISVLRGQGDLKPVRVFPILGTAVTDTHRP